MSTFASGTITFSGNALNDTRSVTINGYELLIGSFTGDPDPDTELATNLIDALDLEIDPRIVDAVTWRRTDNVVEIEAKNPGSAGNDITLATDSPATVILSGPTLTGGTDDPPPTRPPDNSEEMLFFMLCRG